jgi:prepilin-type N-terminal cleavage/methylation domain-containing protein
MHMASRPRGFTLIELMTVIAIIAVLAAILFPLASSVREQARASDCMTKLHQLYVSARVYKDDEGGYPPALMGYAEAAGPNGDSTGVPLTDPGAQTPVQIDRAINGFLYSEQVRDASVFRCPDNIRSGPADVTVAYFPPRPADWPAGAAWIGQELATLGCPSDANGTVDCFTDGPLAGKPKYYYTRDSYDVGPRIGADGRPVSGADGAFVFDRHYSADWTGIKGATDLPIQLKYANPPGDRTLLAYCTWHAATYGAGTITAINLAGSAKKLDLQQSLAVGPGMYAR